MTKERYTFQIQGASRLGLWDALHRRAAAYYSGEEYRVLECDVRPHIIGVGGEVAMYEAYVTTTFVGADDA